jgi:hypothetical protein
VNDPVVVAAFKVHSEAAFTCAALAREDIAAEVGERTDALPRLCVDAFDGGFDVIVESVGAQAAIGVIQHLWPEEPRALPFVERCPACDASEISRLPRLRLFVLAAALLVVIGAIVGERDLFLLVIGIVAVLLLIAPGRLCRACGERWRGGGGPPAAEGAVETPEAPCPRCGSEESETIPRRREKALTLLVAYALPPTVLVWPWLPRRRCTACQHEWR